MCIDPVEEEYLQRIRKRQFSVASILFLYRYNLHKGELTDNVANEMNRLEQVAGSEEVKLKRAEIECLVEAIRSVAVASCLRVSGEERRRRLRMLKSAVEQLGEGFEDIEIRPDDEEWIENIVEWSRSISWDKIVEKGQ